MLRWALPSTPRRKLWLAILIVPILSTISDATSGFEAFGGVLGVLLPFYLIPVAIWEFGLSRLFD